MEEFLNTLLYQGQVHFVVPPAPEKATPQVKKLLHRGYECDLLSLAGSPLTLNFDLALAAAEYVRQTMRTVLISP